MCLRVNSPGLSQAKVGSLELHPGLHRGSRNRATLPPSAASPGLLAETALEAEHTGLKSALQEGMQVSQW